VINWEHFTNSERKMRDKTLSLGDLSYQGCAMDQESSMIESEEDELMSARIARTSGGESVKNRNSFIFPQVSTPRLNIPNIQKRGSKLSLIEDERERKTHLK
jgi:hypothetical protein